MSRYPKIALTREERHTRATAVAGDHDGVAHRHDLRDAGVTRADVRAEMDAGRWLTHGRHTVQIGAGALSPAALRWRALWESGGGAALDGVAALIAGGLTGFTQDRLDVCLPRDNRWHAVEGVVLHRCRPMPPVRLSGCPRVVPCVAVVHAASWARSDRAAVLLLCLVMQQRLVRPEDLLSAWNARRRMVPQARRRLLGEVIRDISDGAHSLGELDLVIELRRAGLPEPSRQIVQEHRGRIYLDLGWEDIGLYVEVDGGHHGAALNPVADALRQNDAVIANGTVLRVPVVGLRLQRAAFVGQIVRAHARLSADAA